MAADGEHKASLKGNVGSSFPKVNPITPIFPLKARFTPQKFHR